jgi:IclR family KDG regulon transcriptional repressor
MKISDSGEKDIINSLNRGLTILELLLEERFMSVTEIGKRLGINKSSAFRLLNTLKRKGFVDQDPETLKYSLGLRLLIFAQQVNANTDLSAVAKPYLKELNINMRETVHLAVMYDLNVMIIAQETGMELLSIITKIGDIEPFYCSAVGKAILAFLPEDEQNTIIDSLKMEKKTQNTITEKEQLLEELARISTKGYAVDNEEFHPGVRCLGVPIFDHRGRVVASLGISGPVKKII